MSRCAKCNQWFIIGDSKVLSENGRQYHRNNCLDVSNIRENFDVDGADSRHGTSSQAVLPLNSPIVLQLPSAATGADSPDNHVDVAAWVCAICTLINVGGGRVCELCGSLKEEDIIGGEVGLEMNNAIDEPRWECRVCTFMSNHHLASYCDACGSDRGQEPLEISHHHNHNNENSVVAVEHQHQANVDESEHNLTDDAAISLPAVAIPVIEVITCVSCDVDLSIHNKYDLIAKDCVAHCKLCLAQWIESQIMAGNSLVLKCLCGNHKLKYSDFRTLSTLLSTNAKTVYSAAQRQQCIALMPQNEMQCPGCDEMASFYPGQVSYQCLNHACQARHHEICVRHNVIFTRPLTVTKTGVVARNLQAKPCCEKCLEAVDGNVLIADVLFNIQNALCDRCYACKGFVGEPADFSSCMVLKCNHCPQCFCGFCYNYADTWQETHTHVRQCQHNPRRNFYAESEDIWRGLMRTRRVALAEAVIAAQGAALTEHQIDMLRVEYMKLL